MGEMQKLVQLNFGLNQTNRLGFMAHGTKFSVYVSIHLLAKLIDEAYIKGTFETFFRLPKRMVLLWLSIKLQIGISRSESFVYEI